MIHIKTPNKGPRFLNQVPTLQVGLSFLWKFSGSGAFRLKISTRLQGVLRLGSQSAELRPKTRKELLTEPNP